MLELENLLKIDLITIPQKMRSGNRMPSQDSRQATSRKSHKSLAINLQKPPNKANINLKKQKRTQTVASSKVSKVEAQKAIEKQLTQFANLPTDKHTQSKQYAKEQTQFNFVEKKMKVGQKAKNNAMKEFILETLMKGKAEGTCLVIHKGTAQCSYSPIAKNKSETKNHQKEQFPLVLVQDSNRISGKRGKQNQSIFGQKTNKIQKSSSTKSTAINLPSINKKWVKMTKQYEKKHHKLQKNESIIQVIQQKIQVCEEQKQNEMQQIREQILISNNESILK